MIYLNKQFGSGIEQVLHNSLIGIKFLFRQTEREI